MKTENFELLQIRNKTLIGCSIIKSVIKSLIKQILIVGCGDGSEAIILSSYFKCKSFGIDLNSDNFIKNLPEKVILLKADAINLPFKDKNFDIVYSYHCLEHIPDFHKALTEMKRVLKNKGTFYIGVPNRNRIVGYINSNSSFKEKILWNYDDYKYKIIGKFRNKFGAHAGFSQNELSEELHKVFHTVNNVTKQYFYESYSTKRIIIKILEKTNLYKILYPSIYFVGN